MRGLSFGDPLVDLQRALVADAGHSGDRVMTPFNGASRSVEGAAATEIS
jgi:hypothetical protein